MRRFIFLFGLFSLVGCTKPYQHPEGLFDPSIGVRYVESRFGIDTPRLSKQKLEDWGVQVIPIHVQQPEPDASYFRLYGEIRNPTDKALCFAQSGERRFSIDPVTKHYWWYSHFSMNPAGDYVQLIADDDPVKPVEEAIKTDILSYKKLIKLKPGETHQVELGTKFFRDEKPGETYTYFFTFFAVECDHVQNKPPLFHKPIAQYLRYVLHQRHEGNIVNITPKRHRGDMVTIFNSPGILFYHEAEFTIPKYEN